MYAGQKQRDEQIWGYGAKLETNLIPQKMLFARDGLIVAMEIGIRIGVFNDKEEFGCKPTWNEQEKCSMWTAFEEKS